MEFSMDTTFLTSKDIAEILKISKALVYQLIAQGQIASVRFGRTVRVKQADLEKFIAQNTTSSQSSLAGTSVKEEAGSNASY
jgi:excisionase family DNA binding protein